MRVYSPNALTEYSHYILVLIGTVWNKKPTYSSISNILIYFIVSNIFHNRITQQGCYSALILYKGKVCDFSFVEGNLWNKGAYLKKNTQ